MFPKPHLPEALLSGFGFLRYKAVTIPCPPESPPQGPCPLTSSPMSPAESSDDSYVSAGEEPLEAPVFEIPLQNVVAAPGADVLLKCIITANPPPQGELQGWGQAKVETGSGRSPVSPRREGKGRRHICPMGLAGLLCVC